MYANKIEQLVSLSVHSIALEKKSMTVSS